MASGRAAVLLVALGGRARRSKFQAPTTATRGTSRADERGHRTRAPRPKVGQSARSPEFNIVVSASGQCDSWRSLGTDVRCFLDGAELEKIQGSGPVRQRVPAPARRAECEGSRLLHRSLSTHLALGPPSIDEALATGSVPVLRATTTVPVPARARRAACGRGDHQVARSSGSGRHALKALKHGRREALGILQGTKINAM